jgi:cyclopropane fatty-acyl-phospholipid synthase-like methyltransferase
MGASLGIAVRGRPAKSSAAALPARFFPVQEAMAFCRLLKSTLPAADYKLDPDGRLLDIGVGWGRIYRVLLRETPHIVGIDVVQHCIDLSQSAFPGYNLTRVINIMGPGPVIAAIRT